MKRLWLVAIGLCVAFGLAGCPKKPTTQPTPQTATAVPAGAATGGAGSGATGSARPLPMATAPAAEEGTTLATVYFAYDSDAVGSEYQAAIAAAARKLAGQGAARLRLEGNTDERGTAEYNVGLGERRAQAVKRALVLAGAPERSIATVSYGAERPAVEGHDESAWAKNRRVDVVALGATP